MVKPIRVFLIFFVALLLLVGLILGVQNGVIPINEQFALTFFSKDELLLPNGHEKNKVADSLLAQFDEESKDSIMELSEKGIMKAPLPIAGEIEQPEGLTSFFKELDKIDSDQAQVRIMHYGDSQLDGDRVTSGLRAELQDRFGGCGVGLISVRANPYGRETLLHKMSDNWKSFTTYTRSGSPGHRNYGVMGAVHRFNPFPETQTDNQGNEFVKQQPGWFSVTRYGNVPKERSTAERLRLFYGNCVQPVPYKLYYSSKGFVSDELKPAGASQQKTWPLKYGFGHMKLEFSGVKSPDLYFISLEGDSGIVVDNIPMRGAATGGFTKGSSSVLNHQLNVLKSDLMILQFGTNVVPGNKDNYDFYKTMLINEVKLIKRIRPEMDILLVGVGDAARKKGLNYVPYESVDLIVEAQRAAAEATGCAFWDLRAAMGGKGSMIEWVNHKPSYAVKDHVHFSARGARKVGEMLSNVIMESYKRWQATQKQPS